MVSDLVLGNDIRGRTHAKAYFLETISIMEILVENVYTIITQFSGPIQNVLLYRETTVKSHRAIVNFCCAFGRQQKEKKLFLMSRVIV